VAHRGIYSNHDNTDYREEVNGASRRDFKKIHSPINLTAKGFTDTLLDPLIDHAATFYASHIWNSIPAVG